MSAWKSITAKASTIAVTVAAASRVIKMLPDRIEAFNEGKYAEAFLGKKWAKILDPDAYSDETTQAESDETTQAESDETTQAESDETTQAEASTEIVEDTGNQNSKNTVGAVSPAQFLDMNDAMLSNMESDGMKEKTDITSYENYEQYKDAFAQSSTPERSSALQFATDQLANIGKPASFDPSFDL